MRKTILGLILISLCITESCQKGSSSDPGGSWTFEGVNYTAIYCTGHSSTAILTALDSVYNGVSGSVNVIFYNVLPVGNGTYTVVKGRYPSNPTQVTLNAYVGPVHGGVYYQSTGGDGTETLSVSYSNGKISLIGSGIEMSDTTHTSDSAALSLNLVQQ